jgi:hypothetical protein
MADPEEEEARTRVLATGKAWWPLRQCSLCNTTIGYRVIGEMPYFDSNCRCTTYWSPLRTAAWSKIADLIQEAPSEP